MMEEWNDVVLKVKRIQFKRELRKAKDRVNSFLYGLTAPQDGIPMAAMLDNLRSNGFEVLDEDGLPLSGVLLTGRDGRAFFPVTREGERMNFNWSLSWHKFETGRYEIVSYLS